MDLTGHVPQQHSSGKAAIDARTEQGLRWSLLRQLVATLAGTIGVLVYSRLIQPADLGAFALAFLVYSGLYYFIQIPIRDAVVYFQEIHDAHSSAAFWLSLGLGVASFTLVMLLAGPIGRFYESPRAIGLTRGLAFARLLRVLAVVPAALLLKNFRFAALNGLHATSILIILFGWIMLAASAYGPWSLVIPQIVSAIFWVLTTWKVAGFQPVLRPGRSAYHDILRFSRSLFGSRIVAYVRENIDNAAVGTLGEAPLGWYSFGEDQSKFAVTSIGTTVAQVALPVLATERHQPSRFSRTYLKMLRLTATLSTPLQAGSFILADLGIITLFGEQWLGAVPVFRAYLIFRLVNALLEIADAANSASGRPHLRLIIDVAQVPFFLAGTWFGLRIRGGILGVAWSLAVIRTLAGLLYFALTMRAARIRVRDTLRYLAPSSLAATLMGGLILASRRLVVRHGIVFPALSSSWPSDALALIMLVSVGGFGYVVMLFLIDPGGFKDVILTAWQIIVPESLRSRLITMYGRTVQGS